MMKFEQKINNYINLILTVGVNIKDGDKINISIDTNLDWFAAKLTEGAYKLGAKEVLVDFKNQQLKRIEYDFACDETLATVHSYQIERDKLLADSNYKLIAVASPDPYAMEGVDSEKIQLETVSYLEKCNKLKKNTASNFNTWCVVAAANQKWADYATNGDIDHLWDMIFTATRADMANSKQLWVEHIGKLSRVASTLNGSKYDYLHFENKLGTDLKVGLVENHIWSAADDVNKRTKESFVANMPTEEVFTMPDKYGVNGMVVASKPLNNNGQIIDQFWIEFKAGKVIDYDAKQGKEALETIITTDPGSAYLGEVALVSKHSPINQMNQLFFNTLFDENSSCHLALGNAYPTNIKGGTEMSDEQKEQSHVNISKEHVDFMFGSEDMKITAYQGKQATIIFNNGDFII